MKKIKANDDGWSDWQAPLMNGYRMGCCDCGLVHDMEFKVLRVTKENEDGTWEADELDSKEYRVLLKAKRNNRSTSQVRRSRQKEAHGD